MIRAVLDTNVYIAAVLARNGAPARLVQALSDGIYDAVLCPALLTELESVLVRPKIARRVPADVAAAYVAWLSRVAIIDADPADVPAVSPDADDDVVLALARCSGADVVVSGDTHLLGLEGFELHILAPAAFADVVDALR